MAYQLHPSGDPATTEYRLYYEQDGKVISPLHDIPLWVDKERGICNMICEIPRGTNAKLEITPGELGNPIKQDVKKGVLRFVDNVAPHVGYMWNYGAFPQTWEDPTFEHPETHCFGDNDPLDVCDIGAETATRGQIKQVKVLGIMALIDEGETDWKVITIDVNDPRAEQLNDIDDVQRLLPGFTFASYEWFRTYKMPAGKPANEFAFHGEARGKAYAMEIIEENHQFWRNLITGDKPAKGEKYDIAVQCVSNDDCSPHSTKGQSLQIEFKDYVAANEAPCPEQPAPPQGPCGVKERVEAAQRKQPHGASALSTVVATVASAFAQQGVTGEKMVAELAKVASGVISGDGDVVPGVEGAVHEYVVAFNLATNDGKNALTFGVYQKPTPHAIKFDLQQEAVAKGHELVLAGFAEDGMFTFYNGISYNSFMGQDGQFNHVMVKMDPNGWPAVDGPSLSQKIPMSFCRH